MFTRTPFRAGSSRAYRRSPVPGNHGGTTRARGRMGVGAAACLVLAGALTGALPAAATPATTTSTTAAPTTTTTSAVPTTTTTTVPGAPPTTPPPTSPPPPPFPMGYDAGPRLVAELQKSEADIVAVQPVLARREKQRATMQAAWDRLLARLAASQAQVREAQRQLDEVHDRVKVIAAQAYTQGAGAEVSAAVSAVVSSESIVSASRDLLLLTRFGQQQTDVASQYAQQKAALDERVHAMNAERVEVKGKYDAAVAALEEAQREYADAQARYTDATTGIARFQKLATTSASPVLGPSFLTADDLAAFVRSRGYHPHISVPLKQLAQFYIDEGNQTGVRGDVAWAQSILETDGFNFPGSGALVGVKDNNFAGIGACDSCKHAFSFKTARLGVRAQMQLLRTYVDPKFGPRRRSTRSCCRARCGSASATASTRGGTSVITGRPGRTTATGCTRSTCRSSPSPTIATDHRPRRAPV